jgi:hypothetical protein
MKNFTFIELQKEYKIVIPQIQRDYAQGREDKKNDKKIKGYNFIKKIINVLTDDITKSKLNLDFVYGYTKDISGEQSEFIPLDGQQRLTTLWLLHWYLLPKEDSVKNSKNIKAVSDEDKKWLGNFTYETRNSSKRFCEELIEESLPVSNDIYKAIKNANWFMTAWEDDPTVVSMLNMIKTIQELPFDREKAWKKLAENRRITFDYIDIKSDKYKLTDELYIKMNSRGRPLTSFENFKAQFSEILSTEKTEVVNGKKKYEGTDVTFQQYFAFRIDSVWTDLFWSFVMQNEKGIKEKMEKNKEIEKNETPISYVFMNFFIYVAQMCYFKDNLNKMATDFKNDFSVFQRKDNAEFLFNILDFFHEISLDESKQVKIENINIFFKKIFQTGIIDDTYRGQVRHFDNNNVNLFEKCLLEGSYEGNQFENRNRIILYCLVSYYVNNKLKEVNDNLIYYIRVIRNLLQGTRQLPQTAYNTNVRINNFGNYLILFNKLQEKPNVYERLCEDIDAEHTQIPKKALKNEKEKAEIIRDNSSNKTIVRAIFLLEEFEEFGGLIHQLKPKENVSKLIDYSKAVREIWSKENDNLAIAALIACDFNGFETKEINDHLWKTFTFGKLEKFGKHNTILTNEDDKVSGKISISILELINTYLSSANTSASEKLKGIISDKEKRLAAVKDWRYYFLKYYEKMLENGSYFAFAKKGKNFEIESLGSEKSIPLSAYHINPYINTVIRSLDSEMDSKIYEEEKCWSRFGDISKIVLKNKIELTCEEDGWHIQIPKGQTIPDKLIKDFDIKEQNILSETDEKDRIEIAVEFCKALYS